MRHEVSFDVLLLAGILALPNVALAQARGGGCDGPFCDLTAVASALLVAGAFVASVAASVKRHGLIRGFIRHGGVQLLLGYIAILAFSIGVFTGLFALFGKL